jgi:hypothetical protein
MQALMHGEVVIANCGAAGAGHRSKSPYDVKQGPD